MSSKYLHAISASFGLFSLGAAIAASGMAPGKGEYTISKAVSYADLNLSSPVGVKELNRRVHNAARDLCTINGIKPLTAVWAERACIRDAIKDATADVELAVARFERQQYARSKFIEIAARP